MSASAPADSAHRRVARSRLGAHVRARAPRAAEGTRTCPRSTRSRRSLCLWPASRTRTLARGNLRLACVCSARAAAIPDALAYTRSTQVRLSPRATRRARRRAPAGRWSQHFSPLVGSVSPLRCAAGQHPTSLSRSSLACTPRVWHRRRLTASVFIAQKLQLPGPVPRALCLFFVGY
jgi:hypothetical protein